MKQALLIAVLVLVAVSMALAEVPKLISYQGKFSDAGAPVADGMYPVKFTVYDQPSGGATIWTETQNVTVTGGLFSVLLGAANPVSPEVFANAARYLGVKLADNPEMTPRQRLVSVPYALVADSARTAGDKYVKLDGDTMSGPLVIDENGTGANLRLSTLVGTEGVLELMHNGESRIELGSREWGGSFDIKDSLGNDAVSLFMNGLGGQFRLTNASGQPTIILDGSGSGSLLLPQNSIDAYDIYNEAGIAYSQNTSTVLLSTTMVDIVTVTINIPSAGYIYLTGKGTAYLRGTTGTNYGYIQIDETAGGAVTGPYNAVFGAEALWTTDYTYWPIMVTRVFQKASSGTYTFRLEGRVGNVQGSGAAIDIRNSMIQAIFVPTRY